MIWIIITSRILLLRPKEEILFNRKIIWEKERIRIILIGITIRIIFLFIKIFFTRKKEKKIREIILKFIILTSLLTFAAIDTMTFLIRIELSLIPLSYFVINFAKDRDKIEATKYFLIINTIGRIPFILFISSTIKINWQRITTEITIQELTRPLIIIAYLLILRVKTPLFLVHVWLTKTHVGASGVCSIILAGIIIKIGTWGIFKMANTRQIYRLEIFNYRIVLGLMTILTIITIIIRYYDIKIIIAISSIAHIRIIIPIIRLKKYYSWTAIIFIIVGHGIISYYLFYLISTKYEIRENRRFRINKSQESKNKTISLIITVYIFINMGLPPLINFIREVTTIIIFIIKTKRGIIIIRIYIIAFTIVVIFYRRTRIHRKSQTKRKGDSPYQLWLNTSYIRVIIFILMRTFYLQSSKNLTMWLWRKSK